MFADAKNLIKNLGAPGFVVCDQRVQNALKISAKQPRLFQNFKHNESRINYWINRHDFFDDLSGLRTAQTGEILSREFRES